MSASPLSKQMSESRTIPTKRIFINDPSDLPSIYSSTPGGTLYSTTPGGTKIVYDKSFLMNLRNSPISKTPPTFGIPESLMRGNNNNNNNNNNACSPNKRSVKNNIPSPKRNLPKPCPPKFEEEEQFQLDL